MMLGETHMIAKNMIESRKAISPILATLLLVVIAVAAIVVTYAWVMTYMGSAGQSAGVMLYKANVRFYDNDQIDVDVGNSGTSDTEIIRIYVGDAPSSLENPVDIDPPLPVSLKAGSVVSLTITLDQGWTSGRTYYFRVVPKSGAPLEFSEKAPS
ncbi:MAG: archaellin/type IV pilin N-terminal domain-containing protein [Nitrososphaerota archaeon]